MLFVREARRECVCHLEWLNSLLFTLLSQTQDMNVEASRGDNDKQMSSLESNDSLPFMMEKQYYATNTLFSNLEFSHQKKYNTYYNKQSQTMLNSHKSASFLPSLPS